MGFHEGELAVQRRAGVESAAARLSGMLAPADLSGGAARFLAQRDFAVLTARDRAGRLWTAPLVGPAGFLAGTGTRLRVGARPRAGDPLAGLPAGQPVGLIAIDLANRRRLRVNGTLTAVDGDGLSLEVVEAFGNCPQYIHPRDVHLDAAGRPGAEAEVVDSIDPAAAALIGRADTFFLGTSHPTRGADASHRGGPAGFVQVDGNELTWPDYPGNNMFNSFGNLAIDPAAALLFIDFETGATVQLSGTAELEWVVPSDADGGTGRRVRFTTHALTQARGESLSRAARQTLPASASPGAQPRRTRARPG